MLIFIEMMISSALF